MKVEITGRRILITPALREYVLKKLRKFTKVFGEDITFHVVVDVEKNRQIAEILLKTKMLNLAGKGETDDMYNSIMAAIEKLERQALKHKGKIIEGKRQRAQAKSVATKLGIGEPTSRSLPPKDSVVREESVQKKPMTVEEATLELTRSDYPFVAFRNSDSGEFNILYRLAGKHMPPPITGKSNRLVFLPPHFRQRHRRARFNCFCSLGHNLLASMILSRQHSTGNEKTNRAANLLIIGQ